MPLNDLAHNFYFIFKISLMQSENKTIDFIKTLIIVNNDRYLSFDSAKKIISEPIVRSWLDQMINQSLSFKKELLDQLSVSGLDYDFVPNQDTVSGRIHKIWREIKSVLIKDKFSAILSSLEFGEDSALRIYAEILDNKEFFSEKLFDIIHRHYLKIKEDFNTLSKLINLEVVEE